MDLDLARVMAFEAQISIMISHNLARYEVGQSKAYTVAGYIRACRNAMDTLGVQQDQRSRIMKRAIEQKKHDVQVLRDNQNLNTHGASEVTAMSMLEDPITDLLKMQAKFKLKSNH